MKTLPFKRIGTGLILAGLLFLTFYIRIQGVERIPDRQFTGNDAYLYYKQAETIAEQGYLPARDMDRWLPLGRDNQQLLSLYAYVIAYTHKVFPWFSVYDIQSRTRTHLQCSLHRHADAPGKHRANRQNTNAPKSPHAAEE